MGIVENFENLASAQPLLGRLPPRIALQLVLLTTLVLGTIRRFSGTGQINLKGVVMYKALTATAFAIILRASFCTAFAFEPPDERGTAPDPTKRDASQATAEPIPTESAADDLVEKGFRLAQRGQFDAAIELFSKVIAQYPQSAEAYLYRGEAFDHKNELERALSDFNNAVKLAPTDPDCFFWRGVVLVEKRDYTHAIADFDTAIKLAPDAAPTYRYRGRCWFHLGNRDKALRDVNEALRLDPNLATAYRDRGHLLAERHEFERAIDDLTRAIALDPQNVWSLNARAVLYLSQGDFDRSIADCTEAIRWDPRFADSYQNRGAASLMKGDYESSITDSTRAIELTGGAREWPLINRACALMFIEKYGQAIDDLEAALELARYNQTACGALALLLASCESEQFRDSKRAVDFAKRANKVAIGDEIQALDVLGMAYAEASDFAAAAKCAERALRSAESHAASVTLRVALEKRIALYRAGKSYRAKPLLWFREYAESPAILGLGIRTNFGSMPQ